MICDYAIHVRLSVAYILLIFQKCKCYYLQICTQQKFLARLVDKKIKRMLKTRPEKETVYEEIENIKIMKKKLAKDIKTCVYEGVHIVYDILLKLQ